MAFTKQKQYDPTEAFLLNEKQQRLLVLQLEKIDKLWYNRLKHLTTNRLEATTDLVRLEDEKEQLEYYDKRMEVHKMKEYNDCCIKQMRYLKREMTHDNYNFDPAVFAERKRTIVHQHGSICLPRIDTKCFVTQGDKPRDKAVGQKRGISRRQSNLMKSKIFSASEPHMDRVPALGHVETFSLGARSKTFSASQDNLNNAVKVSNFIAKLVEDQTEVDTQSPVLPTINGKPDEHRYLKQRMATQLVLPTVTEADNRQRKVSI